MRSFAAGLIALVTVASAVPLMHTSGISGDLGGMDEEPITREALIAKVFAAPLAAKPGQQFEYSNENFSLAAAIVEKVSGQNYETFLRDELWLPTGMKDTGYQVPNWPLERLPIGYRPNGQPWGRTYKNGWLPDGPGWYLRGNGGIQSSLDDLYRRPRRLSRRRTAIASPGRMRLTMERR